MKKTKVFEICQLLHKEEFLDFEFFLLHIAKAGEKTIALYRFLKDGYITADYKWDKASIDKKQIENILYTSQNGSSTFRMLCNDLREHLENYCSFLQMQKEKHPFLMRFLVERNDEKYFWKFFNKTDNALAPYEGIDKLQTQYELWNSSKAIEFIKEPKVRKTDFSAFYHTFSIYALTTKLQKYCALLNREIIGHELVEKMINKEINRDLKWIKVRQKDKKQAYPIPFISQLYVWCIEMLRGNIDGYKKLKTALLSNTNTKTGIIQYEDTKWLSHYLYTFCVHQRQIKPEFYQLEIIEIYFYRYENDLLYQGDFIPVMHIKNICTYAVQRTQMDNHLKMSKAACYKIIRAISKKADPAYKKSVLNHSIGIYHFYFKEFAEVVKTVKKQKLGEYPNDFLKFDDHTLLVRSLYELEKDTDLIRALNNFKKNLDSNDTLSSNIKEQYYGFVLAMRKMYWIQVNFVETQQVTKYVKELRQLLEKPIRAPKWFIEKLQELKI